MKKIQEVAKTVIYVTYAVICVVYGKWFYDLFIKKDKTEKETDDNENVED